MENIYLQKHPVNNLSTNSFGSNPEKIFSESFSNYYKLNFSKIHAGTINESCTMIHEIPIQGLGISDMLSISWNGKSDCIFDILEKDLAASYLRIRAFEFKISDWRKGMLQAYRYNFYSHASILVVPPKTFINANKAIETFKELNVGLWSYDIEKQVLRKAFTPRPNKSYSEKYYSKVKNLLSNFMAESQPIWQTI